MTMDHRTYHNYLHLDRLLTAQQPVSNSPHELLFIVQHQVTELWFTLLIHEVQRLVAHLHEDDLDGCAPINTRIREVQQQLAQQWSVLETLEPGDFAAFRDALHPASGFESVQHRVLEFLLGHHDTRVIDPDTMSWADQSRLQALTQDPDLYEELLSLLRRRGHPVPTCCLTQSRTRPRQHCDELVPVLGTIYAYPVRYPDEYRMCEGLVDIEEKFQLWRFRHFSTVRRIIGHTSGTGGSSGVAYLADRLRVSFFPELFTVRARVAEYASS